MEYLLDENDEEYLVCSGEHGCGAVVADTEAHDRFHMNFQFALDNSKRAYAKVRTVENFLTTSSNGG